MPLAIDLFAGLGGWTDGFLAEGWNVVGFDITRHEYGDKKYPAQLVIQDVLTIHGSQFKDADCIVASPPCQNYSYLAMPWSRSKPTECVACCGTGIAVIRKGSCFFCDGKGVIENSKAAKELRRKWETEGPDNRLFDACFRIQREAIEAAGRHIPLIVENVRGAVPWVGRESAKFGSFYLWGDVACIGDRVIAGRDLADIRAGRGRFGVGVAPDSSTAEKVPGFRFDGSGRSFQTASVNAMAAQKGKGGGWFGPVDKRGDPLAAELNSDGTRDMPDGTKIGGDWFSDPKSTCRKHGSRSQARKAASAMIAKIPLALSRYVARACKPERAQEAAA